MSSATLHKLGKNGPLVPALGFGTMGLTHACYGPNTSEEDIFAVYDRALEQGNTFWDCADLYGDGEEILGKWFKRTGKRDQIFLATKFGYVKGSKTYAVDSSGEYAKKACAESLRLLDVPYIDLFYLHQANPKTPIEETMRALKELKDEGKIKYIGLSAVSSNTLRRACKIAHVDALQTEYSPFVLDIEGPAGTDLLATCRELGVAIVVAMPLGRGLLTSTFAKGEVVDADKDVRTKMIPRFQGENAKKNMILVNQLKEFADKKGCSVTQLALAWLLKQSDDIFPIPGTKQIKFLDENWATLNVKLTDEEEKEIRSFAESAEVAGDTIPAAFASYKYVNTAEA